MTRTLFCMAWVMVFGAVLALPAAVAASTIHMQTHVEYLGSPSLSGVRGEVGAVSSPLDGLPVRMGPRLGAALVSSPGEEGTQLEASVGWETTVWLLNAFGPGFSVEHVFGSAARWRLEPALAVRLMRVGESGAAAVRLGASYDTRYRWGAQFGVTIEWGGVGSVSD